MTSQPYFLIKYNFITYLFEVTTINFILNLVTQKLIAERHAGTQQMIHIDRTEHCYWTGLNTVTEQDWTLLLNIATSITYLYTLFTVW